MYIERNEKPSINRMIGIAINMTVGCFNCGFALAGTLDVVDVLTIQLDWGGEANRNNTIISSFAVLGLTLGSIFSKLITEMGRRRAILFANILITLVTIPYFFTNGFWIICFTRLMFSFGAAVIVNASSLYVSETIPAEYTDKVGISINLGIVMGIFITQLFGLALPTKLEVQEAEDDYLWRISFSLQLISVVITSCFWLFWLQTEPIIFLMKKAEKAGSGSSVHREARKAI